MSTILVVDDAQTDRELMARVVNASGHQVLLAGDGKQAVALAAEIGGAPRNALYARALVLKAEVLPEGAD